MIVRPLHAALAALVIGAALPSNTEAAPAAPPPVPWVERTLGSLSLERKIAQLICPDINAGYIAEGDPRLAHWDSLAHVWGVGMFVLYGGTPRDVAHLLNRLQRESAVPLLISADFEGGPGQQVTGATEYPANMAFAAAGSDSLMYRAAAAAAVEGRAMGIHLTYTPVVDIAVRPENPQESVRSFGGDIALLGRMVHAYVRGYHDNGMLATAKHFPGRGDMEIMPDNAPWTWNPKPVDQLRAQEFAAFRQGIDAGVDFVMTEHIAVPAATGGSRLPASMEAKLASGWLRDSLGFKGILTTDDLWYDHVVRRFGAEEAAVKAFEAGHDILLKPRDPVATIKAMAAAVRSGRISERRVDDAVRRLLTLKSKLGLDRQRTVDEGRIASLVGTPAHAAIAQEAADRSLTLLVNGGVLPVSALRLGRTVNISIEKVDGDPSPPMLAAKLAAAFPGMPSFTLTPNMDPAQYDRIWSTVNTADVVILSFFVQRDRSGSATPVRAGDFAFLQRIIAAKPGAVIAMSYGNPHLVRAVPGVSAFLTGYGERGWYGNQPVYFDSFIKLLEGEIVPRGKLPVSAGVAYPIGTGLTYAPGSAMTGIDLLELMRETYKGKWYSTLTFVQKTTAYRADGTDTVSTWYESVRWTEAKGTELRIDIGDPSAGRGVLYTADSLWVMRDGKLFAARAGGNALLPLIEGVYMQPAARTAKELASTGVDLSRAPVSRMWQGRPVWAVGATSAVDTTSPQFWVDQGNLVVVRAFFPPVPGRPVMDMRFDGVTPLGGGFLAVRNTFFADGKVAQLEEYSDWKVNVPLPASLFDIAQWTTGPHWAAPKRVP